MSVMYVIVVVILIRESVRGEWTENKVMCFSRAASRSPKPVIKGSIGYRAAGTIVMDDNMMASIIDN